MMARLAAALLLAALLAPSAFAQFIYVANAGDDTVSKIDINSNTEVARYATWFTPSSPHNYVTQPHSYNVGPAPSRLLQDSAGNLFVLNRFFSPPHRPVLLKIAPTGGIPGTTTSNGPTNVLDVDDTNNNNEIDVSSSSTEAKDVRIKWAQPIGTNGALGRALCMDPKGFLWVGMYNTQAYYKVDPNTGNTIGGPISTGSHKPYGCQVDNTGRLWSVDEGNTLVEIDTTAPTNPVTPHSHASLGYNYSLSLFNGCGSAPSKVYLSERTGKTYMAYDPQAPPATAFTAAPLLASELFPSVAVGVDLNGDIVSGQSSGGRVIKTNPSGSVVWDTGVLPGGPTDYIGDLHGLIVDQHNDVWAVDKDWNGRVVKYSGGDGHFIKAVAVGTYPYTYGNPPPPTCPCAVTSEPQIKCEKKNDKGEWVYSWSFVVTNQSPFSMPATTVDISAPTGSPITGLTPQQFTFQTPLPPKGQATVTGTFTLAQPIPGTQICFDIRLNAGDGWCCPLEHVCFIVPDCTCASLQGVFRCSNGSLYLELSVTNLGPTTAAGAQIFSNTPGVTVSPATTTLAFPQNTAVLIPLTVTGATLGQVISLSVMLHGPIDPKTGVHSWCCTAVVKVTYPIFLLCWWPPGGWLFDDINANGLRDSGEGGLAEWTVTLTDAKGTPHTTKSDASGRYQFKEIEPGKSRLSVQPPKGWRATTSKGGVQPLSVEAPPKEKLDFGFTKTR
jgi:streptogramin lyase